MAFIKRLEKLGVTENTVPLDPGRERFYVQLRWIHGNLAKREKYVKTAYRSWKRWRLWKPRERPNVIRTNRAQEDEWGPW